MKYLTNKRINVRTLRKLTQNQGLTLRNGKIVEYRSGYQVSTTLGVKCLSPESAIQFVRFFTTQAKDQGRNVGVWLYNGVYYVDVGNRIDGKKKALEAAQDAKQLSIYGWKQERVEWC